MSLFTKFKAQWMTLYSRELCPSDWEEKQGLSDPVFRILCNHPGMNYKVGDALGVFPTNPLSLVDSVLTALRYDPSVSVISRHIDDFMSIQEFLISYVDLDKIPKSLRLFFPEDLEDSWSLAEAILFYQPQIPLEMFVSSVMPLLPRFYSIASAPTSLDKEIELLVRCVSFPGKIQLRYGLCSAFLCKDLHQGEAFRGFIQSTKHFTLEQKQFGKPLVMIGAGTGIAPYKGFLQHRLYSQDPGKNILFFGERFEKDNFYYRDFLKELVVSDKLKLFTAFSRDSESKVYVQDVIEQQKELIQESYEQGAFFFVCGKKVLGSEIKHTLGSILGQEILKELILQKRLVLDVY